MENRDSLFI
jgi:hypothetical protein